MKSELKPPVFVAAIVALVVVLGFVIFKFAGSSGDLDQGQVKYTPGVPPWMDKEASASAKGTSQPPSMAPKIGGNN